MTRHLALAFALIAVTLGVTSVSAGASDPWSPAATLSDSTRSALGVAVADAAQAAPFAAWHEWDDGVVSVYAARVTKGAWSTPARLSRGSVIGGTVRIAATPMGEAVVVWDSTQGAFAARFRSGSWSAPIRVAGSSARGVRVTMGTFGAATVVWMESDASGISRVRAARLIGTESSAPVWVSPSGSDTVETVYAATAADGTPYAAWLAVTGERGRIDVAAFRDGAWSAPATWSRPGSDADLPRIAAASDGDVAVAWTEAVAGGQRPMVRILDNGRLGPTTVLGTAAERIPQITVAAGGAERVAVAWTALDADQPVMGAVLHDGADWGGRLEVPGADSPYAAMTAGGRVILAYRVVREGLDAIVARTGIDETWGEPTELGVTGAIYGPRVTMSRGAIASVIWTAPGSRGDVTMVAREAASATATSRTPHIDFVVDAIRAMERRTGSDSTEKLLWDVSTGNALDGVGTDAPGWLVRTQDCWGRTDVCSSGAVQERMRATIRSIVANAETTVDVSSLAGLADGGFREALISGARDADAAGRRPVIRMVWGHQPLAPFSVLKLRRLHADLTRAAPNLRIVLALHKNTLLLNGYSWNHSKIVAADGRIAYSSGINMWSDSYLQSTNPVTDVGVVVRGPSALAAHRFLDVIWTELCAHPTWSIKHSNTLVPRSGGSVCPARRAPARSEPVGDVAVLAVGRAAYSATGRVVGTRDPREVSKADQADSGCRLPPLPNTMNGDPVWDGNNPSDTALRALVQSAAERVVIGQQEATFGCARDPSYDVRLYDALAAKVADGIPVTIVVSNEKGAISTFEGYSANPPATMRVMKARLTKLLGSEAAATKAACSSLTIARFRYSDAATWPNGKQPALHGKVIAVDDAAVYVGSQNAYPNQLQEFGYIIEDPRAMADFKRDYLDPMVLYSARAALPCR